MRTATVLLGWRIKPVVGDDRIPFGTTGAPSLLQGVAGTVMRGPYRRPCLDSLWQGNEWLYTLVNGLPDGPRIRLEAQSRCPLEPDLQRNVKRADEVIAEAV